MSSKEGVTKKVNTRQVPVKCPNSKDRTESYSLPDSKNKLLKQKKTQTGFRFRYATLESGESRISSADNCQCGLKSKVHPHVTKTTHFKQSGGG